MAFINLRNWGINTSTSSTIPSPVPVFADVVDCEEDQKSPGTDEATPNYYEKQLREQALSMAFNFFNQDIHNQNSTRKPSVEKILKTAIAFYAFLKGDTK